MTGSCHACEPDHTAGSTTHKLACSWGASPYASLGIDSRRAGTSDMFDRLLGSNHRYRADPVESCPSDGHVVHLTPASTSLSSHMPVGWDSEVFERC